MKKIIKIIIFLIIFVTGLIGLMFVFKICPPKGPWPMPPWCASKEFIRPTYNLNLETSYLKQKKAVNMADTWGGNYNFGMIENTRNNIDSSFDRVKDLGAEEVYVHDFHRAVYEDSSKGDFTSLNYKIVDEIFLNDMRDESMTEKDVFNLTEAAHKRGLKLGIKHNIAFVDIGKYITKGLSGNIASSVDEDYKKFNSGHSKEWVRDFFEKWEARMIEKAKIYNKYGVDVMSITPTWMGPTFQGQEALANELWKKLIIDLKQEFKGQIHVEMSVYGILDSVNAKEDYSQYNYYQLADIKEVRLYNFPLDKYKVQDNPDSLQIKKGMNKLLSDLDAWAAKNNIKLSIFFSPFSYPNAINQGIVEYHDIFNETIKVIEKDYEHQANSWQEFFFEIQKLNNLERVIASGMWWDDEMDPDVRVKISISPSFRNKPAEEVIKQWFLSDKKKGDISQVIKNQKIYLYFYNQIRDKKIAEYIPCSPDAVLPVEREIPLSRNLIRDAINLLLQGNLTSEEKAAGFQTEFPLEDLKLTNTNLDHGILTLEFSDPLNKTMGGSCRVGLLRAEIEKTAKQFKEVLEVRFYPEDLLQP